MHQDGAPPLGRNAVLIAGIDVRKVFAPQHIIDGRIAIPCAWSPLPDFRPADERAGAAALAGIPPMRSRLDRFDPDVGPFSLDDVTGSGWAQSLEFLRDIAGFEGSSSPLAVAWLTTWANTSPETPSRLGDFLSAPKDNSTKTDRLIWRAKRVVNCLSHGLALLDHFDPSIVLRIWEHVLTDIAKLAEPTETLWVSLRSGFHPLSPRALWLRALALAAVEKAIPGLLLRDVWDHALDHLIGSVQKDGTMKGAPIMATLSASADIAALDGLPAVAPVLDNMRQALRTLRHDRGTLVMFGSGSGQYTRLLDSILGETRPIPSSILNSAGIVRVDAGATNVWLRAPEVGQVWAGLCEVEAGDTAILTNLGQVRSGIMFASPIQAALGKCKRRDQPDTHILECQSDIQVAGASFSFCRYMKVAKDGRRIAGEDIVSLKAAPTNQIVRQICFVLPQKCKTSLISDGRGVMIVTESGAVFRLHVSNTKLEVEASLTHDTEGETNDKQYIVVCRPIEKRPVTQLKVTWEIVIEGQT